MLHFARVCPVQISIFSWFKHFSVTFRFFFVRPNPIKPYNQPLEPHANVRDSSLRICVPKNILSRHVSFHAATNTQVIYLCPTIYEYIATIHGRMTSSHVEIYSLRRWTRWYTFLRPSMPNFEVLDARIASALNHPEFPVQKENQSGGTEGPERGPFPSWQTDCLLYLRLFPGHRNPWFCRKLHRRVHYCSSKWRCSGIGFLVGRNFIVHDENPAWWHLGKIVQIKNTRVWKTQDRTGIVRPGDSEKVRTWLSQIENYGEEKYRAGNSK